MGRFSGLHFRTLLTTAAAALTVACSPAPAAAQDIANPVYVDDSPTARDTLARLPDLTAAGNLDEAVRVLQLLLDEQPHRLLAAALLEPAPTPPFDREGARQDPDLFVGVRQAVHRVLFADPRLLAHYRATLGPRAEAELDAGRVPSVEETLLLTSAGFEAALRVAQHRLERAQFEAARLTLEQLEDHPDRAGQAGTDAARLLAQLARYLDRPEVFERSERWARQAAEARPAPLDRVPRPWPPAALARGASPLDPLPPLDPSGVISKPLWTTPISTLPGEDGPPGASRPIQPAGRDDAALRPPNARNLGLFPTVAGDLVYINTGATITAWDRFTLSVRWSATPGAVAAEAPADPDPPRRDRFEFRGYGPSFFDPLTLVVRSGLLLAATGRHEDNGGQGNPGPPATGRDGDHLLHALDPLTGTIRWSVNLASLDPSLDGAVVRGPPLIDEGLVIVAVRRNAPERRLLALTLVALDAADGALRWVRPVGSAGWLPYVAQPPGADALTLDRGVIYRTDRLGVAGAFTAAEGRPLWVRRMPTPAMSNNEQAAPWKMGGPIVHNNDLITLSPDRRTLVRLDAPTGKIRSTRSAERLGTPAPEYLVRVGDAVAGIGDDRIGFLPLVGFDDAETAFTPTLTPPGINGRVAVAGDRLLVPTTTGIAIIDPASPDDVSRLDIDEPGNLVALDGQLIVADDRRLHSYLRWEAAQALLDARVRANPADPTPSVTLAELAYRAGRHPLILTAADDALRAIARDPADERARAARVRLFDALHTIIITAQAEPPVPAPTTTTPAAATDPSLLTPAFSARITDAPLLAQLVDRLGLAALTPDQRLAFILAGARQFELDNRAADAAARYQTVLNDPALAGATWRGPQIAVRGELEAARRIDHLIATAGPDVYAPQQAAAATELAALPPDTTPDALERLAARYPLATATPAAYLRLAALHRAQSRQQQALAALERGVQTAARLADFPSSTASTAATDSAVIGDLVGQLIAELRSRGQFTAAARALDDAAARFPGLPLTVRGTPLDAAALAAELGRHLTTTRRWPRLGEPSPDIQALPGWSIAEPLIVHQTPHVNRALVLTRDDAVSFWSLAPAANTPASPGPLEQRWTRKLAPTDDAELIALIGDDAYLTVYSNNQPPGQIVKLNADAPGPVWTADALTDLLDSADPAAGLRRAPGSADRFELPTGRLAGPGDAVFVIDEQSIGVVQRSGRAAILDTTSGEILWSADTGVDRVHDAHLAGRWLAVAGDQEILGQADRVVDLRPVIQILDARTGRPSQRLGELPGRARWVRVTDAGKLLAGLERAALCIDLPGARADWTITSPALMPLDLAGLFDDRLLLTSGEREQVLIDVPTGRLVRDRLDGPRTHLETGGAFRARAIAARPTTHSTPSSPTTPSSLSASVRPGLALCTEQGIALYTGEGELIGVDAFGGFESLLPPVLADGRAITVETVSEGRNADNELIFQLHALSTQTAALIDTRAIVLGARPRTLALFDGRIALTAGSITLLIDAPAGPAAASPTPSPSP